MSVTSVTIKDANAVNRDIAARLLSSAYYQMTDPEVLTYHRVAAGSGDAVTILAAAGVVRAVRVFNGGLAPVFVKLHNSASVPTLGAGVVYTVPCQAGVHNPDPRVSGGGRAFSAGIGMTIVTGLADDEATGVTAESVLVEVEYHGA